MCADVHWFNSLRSRLKKKSSLCKSLLQSKERSSKYFFYLNREAYILVQYPLLNGYIKLGTLTLTQKDFHIRIEPNQKMGLTLQKSTKLEVLE